MQGPPRKSDRAWKHVLNVIKKSDIVLEVLDARMPLRSSKLEELVMQKGKRLVMVLSKCDLTSRAELHDWMEKIGGKCVPFSIRKHIGINNLKYLILSQSKKKPVRVGVVGYPNVGKSSLINTLAHRKAAPVSPIPGVTKGENWIAAGPILFLDTPGVIPGEQSESRLAMADALDADLLDDPESVALKVLRVSDANEFYGCTKDGREALEEIAVLRGKLLKGGAPNVDYAAKLVVRDFQRGRTRRVRAVQ